MAEEKPDRTVISSPSGSEAAPSWPSTSTPVSGMESTPGTTVLAGRYRLQGMIGSGGMGNVYKALDVELDEMVALKMLLPGVVETDGMLELFRTEVKLARRVTHPNVGRV